MARPFLYALAAVRAIIVFGAMILYMLTYAFSCIFVSHSKQRALNLRSHFLKYIALPVLNIHVEMRGEWPMGNALYVANHRSFADPLVICKYLQAFVIAKAEVSGYPIINKGAELTGVIWVDRQDKDSRTATRDAMVETIKSGYNILVYPEGTVGTQKLTLPFRKGTFIEAAKFGIPVIPMAIEYKSPRDLWVLEKFIPQYLYQFSKWRTDVKLEVGLPIKSTDGQELHQLAQSWIDYHLAQMQKGWSESFGAFSSSTK